MKFRVLTQDFTLSSRRLAAATLLASGALSWFFLLNLYLPRILTAVTPNSFWATMGQVLFFGTGILSALLGSVIIQNVDRRKFLLSWIALGAVSTASLAMFQGTLFGLFSSLLLGLSLGLGLPTSLAFVADCSTVQERGRVAGTSILTSFILAFLAIAIATVLDSDVIGIILLGTLIRSTSFFALVLEKFETRQREDRSRLTRLNYKELSFYLFPWIMFVVASVIAFNVIPSSEIYRDAVRVGTVFRYAFTALFGFIWGVVADRVGRKLPIIIGLIVLGLSFSLLNFLLNTSTVQIYLALSGVAWGSFLTVYLVIPGDLSIPGYREKFYALGTISPLIAMISLMLLLTAAETQFSLGSFSQVLSAILFLSVIPVLRAKETLQESRIQERKLKEYVEKVGKEVQKSKEEGT